jgi:hypothetical protein
MAEILKLLGILIHCHTFIKEATRFLRVKKVAKISEKRFSDFWCLKIRFVA